MCKWQGSNATNQNYGAALVKKKKIQIPKTSPQIEFVSFETLNLVHKQPQC